jgi:hypothetical protein
MPAALVGPAGKAGRERCARVPRSLRFPAGHLSIPPPSDQPGPLKLDLIFALGKIGFQFGFTLPSEPPCNPTG